MYIQTTINKILGLVPTSVKGMHIEAMKTIIPFGIGLIPVAYMTVKIFSNPGFSTDKSIPIVPLRPGDSTHDAEYSEDPDAFLKRCEEEYGPVFNIYLLNLALTVISGPQIREVLTNPAFSASDANEEITRITSYFNCGRKSNRNYGNQVVQYLVRDTAHYLPVFTPKIATLMEKGLEQEIGHCPAEKGAKIVEEPILLIRKTVVNAMANIFLGPEIARDPKVIDTLFSASIDLRRGFITGSSRVSKWRAFLDRTHLRLFQPLMKRAQILAEAATPVVLERRRLEALASESGVVWERPDDVLQSLLDSSDKYGFIDLEDVCAHALILAGAYAFAMTDAATNILYFLAAFPECVGKLYEELQQVLDTIQTEREQTRQGYRAEGKPIDEALDPAHDRDMSVEALKRMVYMDSFLREVFRYRIEHLRIVHRALEDITLSSGIVISKGSTVISNTRSIHQSPEHGEDTAEFRPWRYAEKRKTATKVGPDYLVFGMGRRACPARFMNIQGLKMVGALVVSKYSKIEIQDPSKTKAALCTRIGEPIDTGLKFTSRK
ncbi:hypothetical protein BX616_003435 [Lobosporangium transversale]|uniref:Cytochrome P450 n=1 Tax=Lobosporangium transversale TaxID=64571 RepID=A0A1Y2GXF4_9FUNG|nr:cytochrome P450 [Lobosporangium transversale]KAF9898936.1 hypothetical protein BX616_003435 [Lobosporangium transversale]ORZ26451.1 cytochrome P450 [Lobosporangium transversale]|eukprot:XP_021884216.1 cytochrome P450 [Lobosporangium transversale]